MDSGKLDVKLIALDLDDTLLNDERKITDGTVMALRACAEKGIYIVLCSGRAEDAILPFVRQLEIAGREEGKFIIAINGCSIYDMHKRQQVFCQKVSSDILLAANRIAEEHGLKSEVYTPDTIYYAEETKWTKLDVDLCGLKGKTVENYEDFLQQGFTKMLIPGEPEELQNLQKILKAEFAGRAVIFTSKPYFLEVLPPNCGKGEAVSWLSNELGFGVEKTMGFGDSMNDESLIRMAGYGVAMCNGLSQIKEIADFVTDFDNNHDGVGEFLKKYLL
ncbi:MAG: HAD family phosphatase [Treponema sp.]|uniref:Cof-type HAD-IIB family hydrolase n=1 Tax=Treponema sp. TaxID=166 RepID=UPI0025EDA27B|nr:Cof-type HAD-IIB family hydrolase [Treponema sp.]MBQ9281395.1 HAD family phosphatase [Treponema sp.]